MKVFYVVDINDNIRFSGTFTQCFGSLTSMGCYCNVISKEFYDTVLE